MFCLVTRDIIFFLLGDGDSTSVVGGRGDGVLPAGVVEPDRTFSVNIIDGDGVLSLGVAGGSSSVSGGRGDGVRVLTPSGVAWVE